MISQDPKNSTPHKSRVFTAPCSVSDWFNSRSQVTTNQRTAISVELRQQYGLFPAQSQTSCCLLNSSLKEGSLAESR